MKGLRDAPILSFAQLEKESRNIFRLFLKNPWSMPKGRIFPISQSDSGGGVEKVHVFLGARIAKTHPNFIFILPFKSWLTQEEGRGKLIHMEDP
jgi:hypothetical protein